MRQKKPESNIFFSMYAYLLQQIYFHRVKKLQKLLQHFEHDHASKNICVNAVWKKGASLISSSPH
jgi:hypothetical protein